jgi:hypothetical protein
MVTFLKNVGHCRGDRLVLRHADPSDGAAGAGDAHRGLGRLTVPDALEHGMRSQPAGELAHALERRLAALAHDVGGSELARQRYPIGMATEEDDLLRSEAPSGDDAAQADGAVAYHRDDLPRPGLRGEGRVVPVPITSESVSRAGIKASSLPTGSLTSLPSARGTRTASP